MDSKIVNREIRACIWPLLRTAGFSAFSARTAWRYNDETIDVLNFQSFNRYNADVIGVTPFSFCVNLGCYLNYVPPTHAPRSKKGRTTPIECECQFRARLTPNLQQSAAVYARSNRIWSVDEQGLNVAWCIGDVENQIPAALEWFSRLEGKEQVLRTLIEDDERMSDLWGFGRKGSPRRVYLVGYVALSMGKNALAKEYLAKAVESGHYLRLFESVEMAVDRGV
jgi:Domain of unknown function (DUF4304)